MMSARTSIQGERERKRGERTDFKKGARERRKKIRDDECKDFNSGRKGKEERGKDGF